MGFMGGREFKQLAFFTGRTTILFDKERATGLEVSQPEPSAACVCRSQFQKWLSHYGKNHKLQLTRIFFFLYLTSEKKEAAQRKTSYD